VFFLAFHLLMGSVIRPRRPDPEKMTIYECGEPTVGSAWIQFDLRYYVVALLFVIFDVEVAFFFPWAVVFGNANKLKNPDLDPEARVAISQQLVPEGIPPLDKAPVEKKGIDKDTAHQMAWLAFLDILIFFGVLLVGFAYLWRRGDIDWVRSTAAERIASPQVQELPIRRPEEALVGSGS
jgi:NADH-quinone oxidoreductase subunit A